MKKLLYILLASTLLSCNKVELEEDKDNEEIEQPDKPDIPEEDSTICYTISEALQMDIPLELSIKGYIVGYIKGTSMKTGANFSLPLEGENTNMLIADSTTILDYSKCMAVKLEKSGSCATRNELNLYDHPDLFNKSIIIHGYLDKYFLSKGITKIFSYQISDIEGSGGNDANEIIENPGIIEDEEIVHEGRILEKS